MEKKENKSKSDTVGGLVLVGPLMIGLGIYYNQTAVGLLVGLGTGFILFSVVAIWDMAQPPEQAEPDLIAEAFSLMFYLSSASSVRSPEVHARALTEAGFVRAEIHAGLSPTHTLVSARR